IVILASLIEKETGLPVERPLVSAVFHNRLRLGMKLDCDPTVIYGLKLEDKYSGRLLSRDLATPSPYNTYLHAGLPPGPICNPGRQALEAALFPAPESYLYFVAQGDGSHHFSRSFAEHRQAVQRYQLKKN
ncbi:MAG: endolytic transglycosylase MltG, partial [Candidatus Aminicenantales bacterium]